MPSLTVLLVGVLAMLAACIPAVSAATNSSSPVCGFQSANGVNGYYQPVQSMSLTIDGNPNAGSAALSILNANGVQYFVIDVAFNSSLFVPIANLTIVQYTFLEHYKN